MTDRMTSFIGFGEAARAFSGAPAWSGQTSAYDVKVNSSADRDEMLNAMENAGGTARFSSADLTKSATHIFCLVTADQALLAAQEAAKSLQPGALYLDGNSVSPNTKREAAAAVYAAGGRYVDVAIMSPVFPKRLGAPLLLSGPSADDAASHLSAVGFDDIRIVGASLGQASSIKMIRSVMIKGIEALSAECLIAAHKADVTENILESLGAEWADRLDYNLDRMLVHGHRRAAEMEEVCRTLEEIGVEPTLSQGTTIRQSALGQIGNGRAPEGLAEKLNLIDRYTQEKIS